MKPVSNRAEIACQGKEKLTPGQAKSVAEDMRRRGRRQVQHYHCAHCLGWHVGNRVAKLPDKRRQAVEKSEDEGGDDVRS
jgi:hypothetical protein